MADVYRNYLIDLSTLLKESAIAARERRDAAKQGPDYDYESGGLFAYMEVVSLVQSQALAFGIPLDDLGLADLDPENDLL